MVKVKAYIASGIFLLLTLVKILSPGTVTALKARLMPVMDKSYDYKAAVTALGRRLSDADGNVIEALTRLYTGEAARTEAVSGGGSAYAIDYRPEVLSELLSDRSALLSDGGGDEAEAAVETLAAEDAGVFGDAGETAAAVPGDAAQETEDAAEAPQTSEDTPEAVAAFLESQTAYADLEVPANVSYAMPLLSFAYAAPAAGAASGFGYRLHPILGEVKFHYGTDIAANNGDNIYAFSDGTVRAAGDSDSYGLYLILSHADGYETLYAHCSKLLVTEGQSVSLGQLIALVGDTGQATGPHLHFELMQNGVYYNPEYYLGSL